MAASTDVPGVPLDRLADWLRDGHGVDVVGDLTGRLLASGRSNISCVVEDEAGSQWVVRRPPLGHVMPSAHDMKREFTVISGLNRVDLPAPTALAYCDDESVLGAHFLLMSYVHGRVIDTRERAEDMTDAERNDITRSWVDTLAAIHRADVATAGLSDLGRPQGYVGRQLKRWSKQWEITATRPLPIMDELMTALAPVIERIPADAPWSLVHGDYRLDNTILHATRPEVIAVVDWEMATLGDPIADLGVALVYWTQADDVIRRRLPVAARLTDAPGFWSRRQIVDHYADRTGLPLDHLDACTALACFKLAVIMESIRFRVLEGKQVGASADEADGMGAATEALAQLGIAVLSKGALDGLSS